MLLTQPSILSLSEGEKYLWPGRLGSRLVDWDRKPAGHSSSTNSR